MHYNHFTDYTWIVGVGCVLGIFMAYGIGGNDTANSFGTSVGSRALTIRQALIVAAFCESAGAMGLGFSVTDTIRGGILNYKVYTDAPEVMMLGMMCSLGAAGIFMVLATLWEMPVSTTHSIVGAIIGFGLVSHGSSAVKWYGIAAAPNFPITGVAGIVISWVFSPVCSGILAAMIFWSARTFVLRYKNSYIRGWISLPIWVFISISIDVLFMTLAGAKNKEAPAVKNNVGVQVGIGLASGAGVAIIVAFLIRHVFMPKAEAMFRERMEKGEIVADPENPDWYVYDMARVRELEAERRQKKLDLAEGEGKSIIKTVFQGLDNDVHAVIDTNARVNAVHTSAEVFDARTEEAFKYLQVFTAMSMSFAHGANDIANSVGPMAGIWYVYKTSKLTKKTDSATVNDMYWLLALGALGICLGLSTLGYIIMRTLGVKVAKMTPTRGFAAELGAAFIIVIGSKLGLPLSTTHCITGSVVGIGLLERSRGVNYFILPKIIFGWIITLIFCGFVCALFFSISYFSPGAYGIRDRNYYQTKVQSFAESIASAVTSNASLQTSPNYASTWSAVATSLNSTAHSLAKTQVINRYDEGALLDNVLSLLTDSKTGVFNSCNSW